MTPEKTCKIFATCIVLQNRAVDYRHPVDEALGYMSDDPKGGDTLGDFVRRSQRSMYKIAGIWHVRYRLLNSPAFA